MVFVNPLVIKHGWLGRVQTQFIAGKTIELLRISQPAMVDCGGVNLNHVLEKERGPLRW